MIEKRPEAVLESPPKIAEEGPEALLLEPPIICPVADKLATCTLLLVILSLPHLKNKSSIFCPPERKLPEVQILPTLQKFPTWQISPPKILPPVDSIPLHAFNN